jgi:hypothetical protein
MSKVFQHASGIKQTSARHSAFTFTHDGKTLTLREWAESVGISENVLRGRLRYGWEFADALNRPIAPSRRKPRI